MNITLTCIVTGRQKTFFPSLLTKKIAKAGSLEELRKQYICIEAQRLINKGIPLAEVQHILRPSEVDAFVPPPVKQKTTPAVRAETRATTTAVQPASFPDWVREFTGGPNGAHIPRGGTCVRPDIFTSNNHFCDGCDCYPFCLVKAKRVQKK